MRRSRRSPTESFAFVADFLAGRRLAKTALMASLPLVVAATVLSWWAPRHATATTPAPAVPQLFRVTSATDTFCGELLRSHGTLQIYSAGSPTMHQVRFTQVASVEPVGSCGAPDR